MLKLVPGNCKVHVLCLVIITATNVDGADAADTLESPARGHVPAVALRFRSHFHVSRLQKHVPQYFYFLYLGVPEL